MGEYVPKAKRLGRKKKPSKSADWTTSVPYQPGQAVVGNDGKIRRVVDLEKKRIVLARPR